MAMDLTFCIYLANNGSTTSASKTKQTNDPSNIVYQSFLQGVSNDIQRFQALQRVVCGHSACKEAMLKSMTAPKKAG